MTDKLKEIFQRQASYMSSLLPTYAVNEFEQHLKPWPWNLDDRKAQEEFRLLAWRFTEEITEALEWVDREHFLEEVADALHFFIELCIVSGVDRTELLTGSPKMRWIDMGDSLDVFFDMTKRSIARHKQVYAALAVHREPWMEVVRSLGLAIHYLRQRPWRTDHRPTAREGWVMGLYLTFRTFVEACVDSGISSADLHKAYFAKAEINDNRVTKYGVQA